MPSICRKSGALQELVHCLLPCIAKYVFLVSQRELYVGFILIEISEVRLFRTSAFQLQNLNELPEIVGGRKHEEKVLQGFCLCKALNENKDNH